MEIKMAVELNFKVVLGTKDGKSVQKELVGNDAENLMRKKIGEKVDGSSIGFDGYELEITGGSDKAGFPMRKGIQSPRKRIMIGKGVGFSGKKRGTKNMSHKRQKGLVKRRTVCGDMVSINTAQINLKVLKAGSKPLVKAPVSEAEKTEKTE